MPVLFVFNGLQPGQVFATLTDASKVTLDIPAVNGILKAPLRGRSTHIQPKEKSVATYREQLEVLEDVRLKEGQTRRIDCPFCGGKKTFTITRKTGSKVWNCYKASCGVAAGTSSEMSADTIRGKLNGDINKHGERVLKPIPQHLSNPKFHDSAMAYLEKVGSMDAFLNRYVHIRYAPAENRVLFFKEHKEGAVGRALDNRKPKWVAYGDIAGLFTVGNGDIGVVVEDAASACNISRLPECSGCALLGTHITSLQKEQLRSFKRVIVALDKDASRKALGIQRKLEGRVQTDVRYLEEDIKYLNEADVRRLLL